MPIPAEVYRVVASGSLAGGEIWSTGLWVQGHTPATQADADSAAELWMAQLVSTTDPAPFLLMAENWWSTQTTLERVTTYCYPAGGPHAAFIGSYDQLTTGQQGSQTKPNQVALVTSLRTGIAGRRSRGRMYVPLTGGPLGADGQVPTAGAQAIADSWGTFLGDWNASGDNGTVVVVSASATQAYPITQVVVDTRPDIQRRRANRQAINARTTHAVT